MGLPIWRGGIVSFRVLIDGKKDSEESAFMLERYGLAG
jgi:hypothetical protein